MLLNKVKLVNFCCYENFTYSFHDGLNMIILPNGKGKTSLINGIGFALYGPTVLSRKVQDYIRDDSTGKSLVILEGVLRREGFNLMSSLSPRRIKFEWKNTKITRIPELGEFWRGRLVPAPLYNVTICCGQREASLLADAKPATRRTLISALLRFDVINQAIKSLTGHSITTSLSTLDEKLKDAQEELAQYKEIDMTLEPFYREQYYLLDQVNKENPGAIKKRSQLSEEITKIQSRSQLLSMVVNSPNPVCPVCGSTTFDLSKVQKAYQSLIQKQAELRSELNALPFAGVSLTDEQRHKIDPRFSIDECKFALDVIQRKRTLMSSISQLQDLKLEIAKKATISSARKLLRDFLDSTAVPLINTISTLASKMLTSSPFESLELTPEFDILVDGKPFTRFSTAQRDFIAIIFRVVISYVTSIMYSVEHLPLLLDSIGDALDEVYYSMMMNFLINEASPLFPQILMTSHKS